AYRIYRNPTGDPATEGVESVLTLGPDVTGTNFTDTGTITPAAPPPLKLGATGVWMPLPDLAGAREALGAGAGQDPSSPLTWHIYALGGRAGMGVLNTVEHLAVNIQAAPDGSQCFAAWTAGANLSAGRAELSGYSVSHNEAVQVMAGQTYI